MPATDLRSRARIRCRALDCSACCGR